LREREVRAATDEQRDRQREHRDDETHQQRAHLESVDDPGSRRSHHEHQHDQRCERGGDRQIAELSEYDAGAGCPEHAPERPRDDADRARRCPDHHQRRDGEQERRVTLGAQDELDDLIMDILRKHLGDAGRQRLRAGVVTEDDRCDRGDPERERHERGHEEPRERRDVIADARLPVDADDFIERPPWRTPYAAMHVQAPPQAGGILPAVMCAVAMRPRSCRRILFARRLGLIHRRHDTSRRGE
jgi:hypothetical protein